MDGAYNLLIACIGFFMEVLKEQPQETVSQSLIEFFNELDVNSPTAEYFEYNQAIAYFLYHNREIAGRALNSPEKVSLTLNDLKRKIDNAFKNEPKFNLSHTYTPL